MKKSMLICTILILTSAMSACSQKTTENASLNSADLLTEVKTTQYFSDEKVSDADITKILSAGVNAPSAMNTQPWHFTAITNEEVTKKLADAMSMMKPPATGEKPPIPDKAPSDKPKQPPEGGKPDFSKAPNKAGIGSAPLTIVVSCIEGSELSAGLALQNMSAEAQLLGYGTKILTSPTMALNAENQAEYKELLKIPENQKVTAVLLVGKADTEAPDAVSSATSRNAFDEVVTIIN